MEELIMLEECPVCRGAGLIMHEGGWSVQVECADCSAHTIFMEYNNDEEKKAADEARDKELAELRKKFAVAETSKQIMKFVADEAVSSQIAEDLYGAADVDAAITAFQKAWAAKEKALRLEFGKIPAPGAGSSDGPTVTKEQLDAMSYRERVEFATKHPDEYNKLMGR